MLLTLLCNFSR